MDVGGGGTKNNHEKSRENNQINSLNLALAKILSTRRCITNSDKTFWTYSIYIYVTTFIYLWNGIQMAFACNLGKNISKYGIWTEFLHFISNLCM